MRVVAITLLLITTSGCGGGGGPGGPNVRQSPTPVASDPNVDFATPRLAGEFTFFASGSDTLPVSDIFVQDLNNDSKEEVIIAGRMSQSAVELQAAADQDAKNAAWENSNITLYEFNNNDQLVNRTSSWFTGADNVILGTEPSIKFGDFNGDNNLDMAIGHSTDMEHFGPLVIFENTGTSSFNREDHDIGDKWMHDIGVGDVNQDGVDDVVVGGYSNMVVMLGGGAGFTQLDTTHSGNSGLAIGDFLGNGTTTFVFVDSTGDGDEDDDTTLMSFSQTGANTGEFTRLARLPSSRFELAIYDDLFDPAQTERGHDIRAVPFDFNNDGLLDVVVVSNSTSPLDNRNRTEIQFLQNAGAGNFTDVTDDVRVDWDLFTNGDYNPQVLDVNDDGLTDLLFSAQDFNGSESTRVLLQTKEGKFVQSFTDVFEDFATAAQALETDKNTVLNTIRFLTGPNGDKYLVTTVTLNDGNVALYTSKLGDAGGTTAQASIDFIQQTWPYVTDEVAAQIIAGTAFTDFAGFDPSVHGVGIIDLERALLPVGELRMPLDGRAGTVAITGSLTGVNFGDLGRVQAVDSLGRGFEIGIGSMHNPQQQDTWYNVNFTDESYTRMDYNFEYVYNDGMLNYSPTDESGNYTLGLQHIKLAKDWYLQGQYTVLNGRNPWFHMDGMWGTINSSDTFETVITHLHKDFTVNLGTMYTNTTFTPGLVTDVNSLTSMWSEVSWKKHGFRAAIGTMPYLVDGGITLRVPTSIDFTGTVKYTEFDYKIRNTFAEYMSLGYNKQLNFNTSYSIGAYYNGYGFSQTNLNLLYNF